MNRDQTAPYLQRRGTHAKWQSTNGKPRSGPLQWHDRRAIVPRGNDRVEFVHRLWMEPVDREWVGSGRGVRGHSTHQRILRPSAHPHRVLDARRRGADRRAGRGRGRRRPAGLGITDHGNMYGVLDFYKACRERGITPIIGTEAYMAAQSRHERPVGGAASTTPAARRAGREALLPPDPARRDHAGLPQPHQALVGRLPRGLLLQAPRRLGAARAPPRRPHRHHRLPRRRRAPGPARGRLRGRAMAWPAGFRTSSAGTTSSSSCRTTGCRHSGGPIPPDPDRPRARTPRCSPPTTATTAGARTRSPTTPCCACRPAPRSTTRSGSSSRATSTT